ncbi:MAG: hypothetical protein JNK82_44380, partial [Myxococcaceae bacterium]|nr:hypothetical protein [Myxococcaceae bacterium]
MLATVLAISLSMLGVQGESACPTVTDVLLELERAAQRGPVGGMVEIEEDHLWLRGLDGAMSKMAVVEGSCAERASAAAQIILEWEWPPPAPAETAELRDAADVEGRTFRLLGAAAGAIVGAAIPLVVTMGFQPRDRGAVLVISEVLAGVPVLALTALIGHYLGGGQGHYGWAILGSAVAVAGGVVALFAGTSMTDWAKAGETWRLG